MDPNSASDITSIWWGKKMWYPYLHPIPLYYQ